MASPTASSPAAAPTLPSPPLNPLTPNVYRPAPPSHHADDGDDPKVAARFAFSAVVLLRIVAIAFAVILVVLEFERKHGYYGLGAFPIVLAFFQLFWLVFATLRDLGCPGGGRSKGFSLDFGFVKCIFGRRGYDDADEDEGRMLLGWAPFDSGKKKWRRGLVVTVVDLVFATVSFALGMVVMGSHAYPHWLWNDYVAICAVAFVVA